MRELGNCHVAWAPDPLCLSKFSPNTINLLFFRIKKKDRLCCLVGHFWLSLGLQIYLAITPHFLIYEVGKSCKHVKHISSGELVEFKVFNCVQVFIHAFKISRQSDADSLNILVSYLAHYFEKQLLVGVPVYLLIIEYPNRSKSINKNKKNRST